MRVKPLDPIVSASTVSEVKRSAAATWWRGRFPRRSPGGLIAMAWIRDRALTLATARLLLFFAGQMITGSPDYSSEQAYAETGR